jgi:predicted PurR-regulated permease PerM
MLTWGFVGIFLGTTLLAIAYTTFFTWLENEPG